MGIFNERLKELKDSKDIMLKDLASDLETSSPKLSNYLNGNSEPSYEFLLKIAKYFNVTTDFLIGNDVDNQNTLDELTKLKIQYSKIEQENKQLKAVLKQINELSTIWSKL